jgi:membrane protease YdiL (CAAX protease family)
MTSVPPPSFQHPGPPPARPELPEGVEAPPPEKPTQDGLPALDVPWWAPFAALLATFFGVLVLGVIAGIVVEIAGGDVTADDPSTGLSLVLTTMQDALFVFIAWYAVDMLGTRPTVASFGLRGVPVLRALGWTLLAYAGFWVATGIVVAILGEPEEQQLVQDIETETAFGVLAGYALLSCFIAPLAEEFFFRGFMFRALAGRMHAVWAALVTGGVFGLIHLGGAPLTSVVVLSIFGVALCFVLWRTGSLIPCIMLHAFNNSIAFGATKELPWWGFLLLVLGSVGTALGVSLLAARLRPGAPSPSPA